MKRLLLLVLVMAIGRATYGQPALRISLRFIPEHQVLGWPVQPVITLENTGAKALQVPDKYTIIATVRFRVQEEGKITFQCPLAFDGSVRWETLEGGTKREYFLNYFPRVCASGEYPIAAIYDESRYLASSKMPLITESAPVSLFYESPAGEDMRAYRAIMKQIESEGGKRGPCMAPYVESYLTSHPGMISAFPASTYAGYVVYEASGAKGLLASDPAYVAQSIAEGSFLNPGSVPDDTGKWKDGWQSLTTEGVLKWREKWFSIVLKNHPDIWFADALRLKRAVDQIALKNYQAGAADLQQLSANAKPDVAEKAKQYLGLTKQKGWVKE